MQRRNRQEQLAGALAFANHKMCRMQRLISHFGDHNDAREPCKICDRCCGPSVLQEPIKRITTEDSKGQQEMLLMLLPFQSKTTGQVYRDLFEPRGWDRRRYDGILWDLESQGLLFQAKHSFTKNGETIDFLRVGLTDEGRRDLHSRKLAPTLAIQRLGIDERVMTSRRKASNRKRTSGSSFGKSSAKSSAKSTAKPSAKPSVKSPSKPSAKLLSRY